MKRCVNWRMPVLIVAALSLFSSLVLVSNDVSARSPVADEKAQGPKDPAAKGPKKQGPFVTVSGVVTNSLTGGGVGGVAVTFAADSVSFATVTDDDGTYAERLPVTLSGPYAVSFEAQYFNSYETDVVLVKGNPLTLDVALEPLAPVIVSAGVTDAAVPGATLTATGEYVIMDGSSLEGVEWSQAEGADAAIADPMAATTAVTLPPAGDFKAELIHLLMEPPITEEQLPPNIPVPEGEFVGGLQDRYQVVAINHFALERAGHVPLLFAVTTSSGTYSAMADIHAALPWRVNPGLRNLPIDVPVLLHGKDAASYEWTVTSAPAGSGVAALMDATTQNPEFVPDVAGVYEIMENVSNEMLTIHAGTWRGVIVGQDAEGLPVSDAACTGCHSGGFAPDNFTPWSMTGHAERFTTQLNGTYYPESCFGCHTVGYDLDADNGGMDDAPDYVDFLASPLRGPNDPVACPDGDWACMLEQFPDSAQLANIQCENCHGPQDGPLGMFSTSHGGGVLQPDEARVSLSSEVCASCHGEPLRHARFQQWQLSRHSNYEVAIDEGDSGNCSRCHTANGFLAWLPALLSPDIGDEQDNVEVTWTADEVHPQTCVTCHDPHMAGTTSGNDTNANTRISGDTPMLAAGFQAFGVGKGAMCMTCHNTRRGLRNDSIDFGSLSDPDRAPHGGVQADLIMGQNAYFVEVGVRGAHSFVSDTCVNCHMVQTDPPADLAYNLGGANHTFFASRDVCIECHTGGEPNADGIQAAIGGPLHQLEDLIVDYYTTLINDLLTAGNVISVLDGAVVIDDIGKLTGVHLSETRGRQALIVEYDGASYGPAAVETQRRGNPPTEETQMEVLGPSGPASLFSFVDEVVAKATWNWLLVHTDASGGVHNPAFSSLVLERAIAQMNAL